jgi:hypothetical protein
MSRKSLNPKDSKKWLLNSKENTRTTKVYGGCKVYSSKGNLMFLCLDKKAKWYLNKVDEKTGQTLAYEIYHINPIINFIMKTLSIKPKKLKIKFRFEMKGEGTKGDKYSLAKKKNRCVVTGDRNLETLTRHHITPYCYRMFLPLEYKEANSHDIVTIIDEKHYAYERHADKLKVEIAKKYDAPIEGKRMVDHKFFYALKSARALKDHSESMPNKKIDEHKQIIRNYTGQKRVTQKVINDLCAADFKEASKVKSHGEIVVEKLMLEGREAIQEFVEMWRKHFLEHAKPKYMPKHWDVKRPASRLDVIKK